MANKAKATGNSEAEANDGAKEEANSIASMENLHLQASTHSGSRNGSSSGSSSGSLSQLQPSLSSHGWPPQRLPHHLEMRGHSEARSSGRCRGLQQPDALPSANLCTFHEEHACGCNPSAHPDAQYVQPLRTTLAQKGKP